MGKMSSFIWTYVQCEGLGHRDRPSPLCAGRGLQAVSRAWKCNLLKWPFVRCPFPQLKR